MVAIRTELGDQRGVAQGLNMLAGRSKGVNDVATSKTYYEQSLRLYRELGQTVHVAGVLNNLGTLLGDEGEYAQARMVLEESRALLQSIGWTDLSFVIDSLARSAVMAGDYGRAGGWFAECLSQSRESGELNSIEDYLEGMGSVAAGGQRPEDMRRAAVLWGVAEALSEANRNRFTSWMGPNERRMYEQRLEAVRLHLGDAAFAAAWTEGRSMSPEQAIAYALENTVGL
jgi:hypothetical protein